MRTPGVDWESFEQSMLKFKARRAKLYNGPNLRKLLNALTRLEPKHLESKQTMKKIDSLLNRHSDDFWHYPMLIGYDKDLVYVLKPGPHDPQVDCEYQPIELLLSFTKVCRMTTTHLSTTGSNLDSSTTLTFLFLGILEPCPLGEVEGWASLKPTEIRLCLLILDNAGGGFWKLEEEFAEEGTFKATWLTGDVDGLSKGFDFNSKPKTELMLRLRT